ncbi:MAG: homoserine dehydrogenase [Chloroflexota bacterium]
MKQVALALVGFGNVGQAFARLLLEKEQQIAQQFGYQFIVTGIITGRHGSAVSSGGISLTRALEVISRGQSLDILSEMPAPKNTLDFLFSSSAEAMLETSPVNHHTGQPAIDHIKAALNKGMHAITANKGPVVHAYRELMDMAAARGKRFLFEAAVMDGAPIFSLFRGPLPCIEVHGFQGILNSCTNFILGLMENGKTFEEAVREAQAIGIAETDPSADIDGWDAAIKVAALSTVVLGIPLKPQQVERSSIREITPAMISEARQAGERWKVVCTARRKGKELLEASVKPQRVSAGSPLFAINGTSSYVEFHSDVLPGLGIVENNPGPNTTAYGLLADLINALRGQ